MQTCETSATRNLSEISFFFLNKMEKSYAKTLVCYRLLCVGDLSSQLKTRSSRHQQTGFLVKKASHIFTT